MTAHPPDGGDNPQEDRGPTGRPAVEPVRRTRHRNASPLRNAIEWAAVIVGAVLVALLVRNFVVQSFQIPSGSMHPTLIEGDRVLVNRLSYRLHDINRGDVIVFGRPDSAPAAPGEPEDLIKRVIALPGETISAEDGVVMIDGAPLTEPYLDPGTLTGELPEPVTVPEGELFVMGDNRGNSSDSRFIGTIPEELVVGRAFAIIWPPSRLAWL
ncbi:MAG: signal peptidase I [Microthrixaceae bacterium]|nr:signal peptidase I [Microthrixaceae bacterium]